MFDFQASSLACKCLYDCKNFKWIKDGKIITPTISNNIFQEAVISSSERHLNLNKDLYFDVNGTYGCLVDDLVYKETTLQLYYTPKLESSLGEGFSDVPVGSEVSLKCSVRSAFEIISISWMFNNFPLDCSSTVEDELQCQINETNNVSELVIPSVDLKNDGQYMCVVTSVNGHEASSKLEITVKENMPVINGINVTGSGQVGLQEISENEFLLLENSELVLNCNHNGSQITWSLPNGQKQTDINPLAIKSVDVTAHQGTYFCTVSNSQEGTIQSHVNIVIFQPARIKEPEENHLEVEPPLPLKLSCDAIVDERLIKYIYFEWQKDGETLPFQNKELYVEKVSKDDSGDYKCSLKSNASILNTVEQEWKIVVKQAPRIAPSFPSIIPLVDGGNLTIKCHGSGIPSPIVEWSEASIAEDYLVDPRNVISELDHNFDASAEVIVSKAGIYKCKAKNDYGSATQGIEVITVQKPVMIEKFTNESTVVANAGSSVMLNCSIRVDSNLEQFGIDFYWYKNDAELDEESTSLTIPYLVDRDHAGVYSCHVKTVIGTLISSQTLEIITEIPMVKIDFQDSNLRVALGSNVTLHCEIQGGIPTPTIEWKFGDKQLDSSSPDLNLGIITEEDEGKYSCLGVNIYGNAMSSVDLEIITPPSFIEEPEDLSMKTMGMVRIPCKPLMDERVKDEHSIIWFFNSTQELSIEDPTQLIINQVTDEDEGMYTCIVDTPYGTLNKSAELNVLKEKPSFISIEKKVRTIEGSSAILSCQANGIPLPEIFWKKQDANLTADGDKFNQSLLGDLTINDIKMSDQGTYKCIATNLYGTIETSVEMEVVRRSMPSDDQTMAREVVKNVHDNVTLNCGISFDPRLAQETKVQWFKLTKSDKKYPINMKLLLSSEKLDFKYLKLVNNSLLIHDLNVEDKGKYLCSVKTPYESLEYNVELFVHGEPPRILSKFKKHTLNEGMDLILPCLAKGVPTPTLKWFFNGNQIDSSLITEVITDKKDLKESRIQIPKVTKIHEGTYQCEAANTYGSGIAKYATIKVVDKTSVQVHFFNLTQEYIIPFVYYAQKLIFSKSRIIGFVCLL